MPEDKNLAVFLNNTGGTNLNEMNKAIRAILYNKPYEMPKISLAETLHKDVEAKGLKVALANFKENKKSDSYEHNEGDINVLGYTFLQLAKVPEAIEIFKLNVAAFPNSGNCYDSLGEAYLASGDKKLALLNYKKSVDLDPTNESGKQIIIELSE